jgi:hypothetical protein
VSLGLEKEKGLPTQNIESMSTVSNRNNIFLIYLLIKRNYFTRLVVLYLLLEAIAMVVLNAALDFHSSTVSLIHMVLKVALHKKK